MFEDHNIAIHDVLKETGRFSEVQLNEFNETHLNTGKSLANIAIDSDLITKEELLQGIAAFLHLEYEPKVPTNLEQQTLRLIKADDARKYGVIPIEGDERQVTLLTVDPFNSHIVDDLTFSLDKDIRLLVGDPDTVESLIRNYYGDDDASIDEILREFRQEMPTADTEDEEIDLNQVNQAPIIRFVNLVLQQAIKDKASDIHFEPYEDKFRIRYRVDGALYEMAPPPRNLATPVISRIKVMSSLNIAERRIPQDGRIKMTIAGRPVDLRVSTLPTQFGESVVLRVLDKSVVNLDLDSLNMPDDVLNPVKELFQRPNGIFIVTGPTGSGKTTTLYSGLRRVNTVDQKILTAEDPVEYEIEGIMQVPINHTVGLTFAAALRSFLRQDPDVIMVGEIRDLETAQIAVQASLTGHLVLSTLHTNDSAGAVTRLVDMGLEPYLIAASLEAVLAQRLVRRICAHCRTSYEPSAELIEQLEVDPIEIGDNQFYYGSGCPVCEGSGYKGRMGLYELIVVNDAIRALITRRAPSLEIRLKSVELGMRTLRDDGLRAIFNGDTSIEEVLKYT
jgi:type IV pilus assembly protein PilB